MAAPIVTCMVPLSHNICGSEVFSWSLDHKTAIATDHCVYIMDIQCSSSDSSKSFTLPKSVIPASEKSLEFDVQISEETVLENIQLKPSESLATMTLDPTLSPRIGLPEVYLGYKMVKWSPLHCDQQGRSLLCCLTMDHRLTIYKHMAVKKWEKIIDVSELLYSTVKENKFKFPHHLTPDVHKPFIGKCEIYERYKKRHYMLAVIAMEWSDLYHSHKDTTLTPAKKMKIEKVAEKFTLLATLNRSSHVVIWKLMTPIISENSLTIHGVIDTSFETPVSLSWCHLSGLSSDSLSNQYGIFAVGDISGQIVVWKMDVHCRQSGSLDSLTVWEDKDLLSPSKMTWKYMANKDIYILAAAKGAYLMIFMIKIKDNKLILVSKYQPSTVHPVSITGLSFQDNIIMTLSMEGTIKKTIIKVEQNAISSETQPVLLNANEKEIRKYHYVVLSPNCVYAAFVTSLLNNITKKTKVEVQIMEVCNESELLKYLLAIKGSLSNYVDTIEYIRQHIVSDNLSQPLQQFMKSTETTPALIKLGLFIQRIQLNQVKQTLSGKTVTEGEEISDDIKELKSQENQLMQDISSNELSIIKTYIIRVLKSWKDKRDIRQKLTQQERKCVLIMADWLNLTFKADEECNNLTSCVYGCLGDKAEGFTSREVCPLCQKVYTNKTLQTAHCIDGHIWSVCCLTLSVCSDLPYRKCCQCNAKANNLQTKVGSFFDELMLQTCTYCDGMLL